MVNYVNIFLKKNLLTKKDLMKKRDSARLNMNKSNKNFRITLLNQSKNLVNHRIRQESIDFNNKRVREPNSWE